MPRRFSMCIVIQAIASVGCPSHAQQLAAAADASAVVLLLVIAAAPSHLRKGSRFVCETRSLELTRQDMLPGTVMFFALPVWMLLFQLPVALLLPLLLLLLVSSNFSGNQCLPQCRSSDFSTAVHD